MNEIEPIMRVYALSKPPPYARIESVFPSGSSEFAGMVWPTLLIEFFLCA